jgi:hypothetical protein
MVQSAVGIQLGPWVFVWQEGKSFVLTFCPQASSDSVSDFLESQTLNTYLCLSVRLPVRLNVPVSFI